MQTYHDQPTPGHDRLHFILVDTAHGILLRVTITPPQLRLAGGLVRILKAIHAHGYRWAKTVPASESGKGCVVIYKRDSAA